MAIIKTKFSRGVEGTTNIVDAGTEGTKVAAGTTAQRGSTAGQIRFNTTTGLAEYYTGTAFKSIDAPPTVTSIDVTEVDSGAGGNQTIVITGTSFSSGATVTYVGANGTNFNASTVTINSSTQITAVAPKSSFLNAQEPYGVKVTNTTGLSATLASQINVDISPTWSTSSGSLGSFNNFGTVNVTPTATDPDGDTIAYSVQSGSLPSGLSLNTSTGAITGTIGSVGSSTTFTFTLRATANSKTADRQFTITNAGPNSYVYSYTGSNQTFTVPSGVTSFQTYIWGAGGVGGASNSDSNSHTGGAGGAGGYVAGTISNYSAGQTFSLLVGQGTQTAYGSSAIASYGGGGSGCDNSNGTQPLGGHGGGRSEISIGGGLNTPAGTRILIAGGGAGGGAYYGGEPNNNTWGGDAAYTTGQNGEGTGTVPTGGSQSAGGSAGSGANAGSGNAPTGGSAGIGGMARAGNQNIDIGYGRPGGGGGGYYGGGGGDGGASSASAQGGGGGSSYYNSSYVSSFAHATGSQTTAPQSSNTYYATGIAKGGIGTKSVTVNRTANIGGNGRIVIVY